MLDVIGAAKSGSKQRQLLGRAEVEGAGSTCWPTDIVRVADAIHDRHLGKVERAYPVQAGHVHAVQLRVGSSLEMRGDPAAGTEEVPRGSGVEAVARQRVLAPQESDSPCLDRDNHGSSHSAVGAVAAPDRAEVVAQPRLEAHRAAVALASPYARSTCHVVCVSWPVQMSDAPRRPACGPQGDDPHFGNAACPSRTGRSARTSGTMIAAVAAAARMPMVRLE